MHIDHDIQQKIESYALAMGSSPAHLLRTMLDEFTLHHPIPRASPVNSAYELLQRDGLIGCLSGEPCSPNDLSTNPNHMRGFGAL